VLWTTSFGVEINERVEIGVTNGRDSAYAVENRSTCGPQVTTRCEEHEAVVLMIGRAPRRQGPISKWDFSGIGQMADTVVSEVGGRGVHLAVVSRELYTKLDAPTARLPNPYIGEIEGTVHTFHGMVASFARRPALFATTFLGAATGPGDVGATDAADVKTGGEGKVGAGGTAGAAAAGAAAAAAAVAEGARCRRQARMLEAQLEAAAAAIRSATHLLVAVGAGFSADGTGGLPGGLILGVAGGAGGGRGTDSGACGAAAAAASSASADATAAGYGIVQEWMEGKDGFVYTSNVDRGFLSSGFDPARLYEVHGDAHTWQCSVPCGEQTFDRFGRPASAEGDSVAGVGEGAEAGAGAGAGAGVANEGKGAAETSLPPSASSHTSTPTPTAPANLLCSACGAPARPYIGCPLLSTFGDDEKWVGNAAAEARYEAWEEAMEKAVASDPSARLVVVEIGCGVRVPGVRVEAEVVVGDTLKRIRAQEAAGAAGVAGGGGSSREEGEPVSFLDDAASGSDADSDSNANADFGSASSAASPGFLPPSLSLLPRALLVRINPHYPGTFGDCHPVDESEDTSTSSSSNSNDVTTTTTTTTTTGSKIVTTTERFKTKWSSSDSDSSESSDSWSDSSSSSSSSTGRRRKLAKRRKKGGKGDTADTGGKRGGKRGGKTGGKTGNKGGGKESGKGGGKGAVGAKQARRGGGVEDAGGAGDSEGAGGAGGGATGGGGEGKSVEGKECGEGGDTTEDPEEAAAESGTAESEALRAHLAVLPAEAVKSLGAQLQLWDTSDSTLDHETMLSKLVQFHETTETNEKEREQGKGTETEATDASQEMAGGGDAVEYEVNTQEHLVGIRGTGEEMLRAIQAILQRDRRRE
jgi:hypothetical protein